MIDQGDSPWEASVAEMPSRPTSVAVSKPSPNSKPSGNMCQLRLIRRNSAAEKARQEAAAGQQHVEVFVG